jgi:hypothetical protein
MPEALQALDNLASDALDTFGVFGVGWKGTIGNEERFLVVVASLGDARELFCDRVREDEWAPRRRRAWGTEESCEAVSRCIVVIAFGDMGHFFDSCSLF